MIDEIQKNLLREVADLHNIPEGAYNIRANGGKIQTSRLRFVINTLYANI